MPLRLMIDLSSNNAPPDLKAHWAAGYRTLALKASEATTYRWADHGRLADEWHSFGGKVIHYHFLHPGSGALQAANFLAAVRGHLHSRDRVCVDVETPGVTDQTVQVFIERVHQRHPRVKGLIYGPPYFLRDNHIRPHRRWGLWLADYGQRPSLIPPGWLRWTAWQYTDRAKVPGVPTPVDQSHIRRTLLPRTDFLGVPVTTIRRLLSRITAWAKAHPKQFKRDVLVLATCLAAQPAVHAAIHGQRVTAAALIAGITAGVNAALRKLIG